MNAQSVFAPNHLGIAGKIAHAFIDSTGHSEALADILELQ